MRGLETKAGAVSGVVTERGPMSCHKVVLAGGAWSRLFCSNLGVELPQLKLLVSVMRSGPVEGAAEHAAGADDFGFGKRLDGGYTIARRNANVAELTPDSFRLLFDFLPAVITQWHELRLRVGRNFLEEWRVPRRWALDAVSPFETVRSLDPTPSYSILDEGEKEPRWQLSGVWRALGRCHRRDARRCSRHLRRPHPARLLYRQRLLGAWLRHRPGRGVSHGRLGDREDAVHPPHPLSLRPISQGDLMRLTDTNSILGLNADNSARIGHASWLRGAVKASMRLRLLIFRTPIL